MPQVYHWRQSSLAVQQKVAVRYLRRAIAEVMNIQVAVELYDETQVRQSKRLQLADTTVLEFGTKRQQILSEVVAWYGSLEQEHGNVGEAQLLFEFADRRERAR